jgi:hypothetical protein
MLKDRRTDVTKLIVAFRKYASAFRQHCIVTVSSSVTGSKLRQPDVNYDVMVLTSNKMTPFDLVGTCF